jgi:putative nucleotidyltransferase with HDIG domain
MLSDRPEVRPFPAAVTQLLAAMQDASSTSGELAQVIECDPSLSIRLLKMANSPMYGARSEVRSIDHAASFLGRRALKTLAMSVAGATMFTAGDSASANRESLWNHSIGTAAVARILAGYVPGMCPDNAFLACVFHDVGKLMLTDVATDLYADMTIKHSGEELTSEEEKVFGISHEGIGMKSAISWGLPEDLRMAIGYHHRPSEAPVHFDLVAMVHVANNLARLWQIGSSEEFQDDSFADILNGFGMDDQALESVREQAIAATTATQQAHV